jgi:hypothetical protein
MYAGKGRGRHAPRGESLQPHLKSPVWTLGGDIFVANGAAAWEHSPAQDRGGDMGELGERRAVERFAVNTDTACAFAGPVEELGAARIKDVSMQGIGLVISKGVAVGTVLAVTLTNASRNLVKTVLVRVAHVTSVPGGFLVGGTFLTPLTYQEMSGFVL